MPEDTPSAASDDEGFSSAKQRTVVRERYASIATSSTSCCTDSEGQACCTGVEAEEHDDQSLEIGYTDDELDAVAPGANLGLGCGNPAAIGNLEAGETVLDLGSGAGFDCFLAAREVGPTGQVIGVDMTPEMLERARENVGRNAATNVEFRLGEIEHLPVADDSVDVIISNCVVNLSPEKPQVFAEAFRVLRPGGRLVISDVVLTAPIPAAARTDPTSVAACVAGASSMPKLEAMLTDAGFIAVSIEPKADSETFIREWDDKRDLSEYIVSASIEAQKPTETSVGVPGMGR